LESAGLRLESQNAERIALIFAILKWRRHLHERFYVTSSLQAAGSRPLRFPETVFNAPASHLAAILGVTGATYTLVGDEAVGLAR